MFFCNTLSYNVSYGSKINGKSFSFIGLYCSQNELCCKGPKMFCHTAYVSSIEYQF